MRARSSRLPLKTNEFANAVSVIAYRLTQIASPADETTGVWLTNTVRLLGAIYSMSGSKPELVIIP